MKHCNKCKLNRPLKEFHIDNRSKDKRQYICISCKAEYDKDYNTANKQVNRLLLYNRDEFRCSYCGMNSLEDKIELTLDHITPKVKGGEDVAGNLITSCKSCNSSKCDKVFNPDLMKRIKEEVKRRNKEANISDIKPIKLG